jgi:Uri superfamily endonuclease
MYGIYHLLILLLQPRNIIIGKLGIFQFLAGYYVYTGSALNGLEARIARHRRQEKRLHWHIDYLLQYGKIIDVVCHITKSRLECEYNRQVMNLPGAQIIVPKFGASDCKCDAHLVYFPNMPNLKTDEYIN